MRPSKVFEIGSIKRGYDDQNNLQFCWYYVFKFNENIGWPLKSGTECKISPHTLSPSVNGA